MPKISASPYATHFLPSFTGTEIKLANFNKITSTNFCVRGFEFFGNGVNRVASRDFGAKFYDVFVWKTSLWGFPVTQTKLEKNA